ncbi:LANO_0A00540g1_1 [Lachancea nothofagi CBS 11611]|uniref:LANO_0A00540g1_1 n=1 Tax=Lachancea nothofagi CBS 11611 TaxID=1266666 RepID=A0A1G4ILM4_9SACH|nr:LANO_0A00540g1_1 [Lachancea nothofagi CBS 11611]
MLVPPANFGIAEEGIYRSSKIETLNLSFLETLNLRTVIFVGGQEPSKFFREFFERSYIQWFVVRTADVSSSLAPVNVMDTKTNTEDNSLNSHSKDEDNGYELSDNDDLMIIKSYSLKRTFELLLSTSNHNTILVDKTSIVVGILRKIQKWNIASIINEYRLFAAKNSNYFAETFLEMINVRIVQEEDDSLGLSNLEGLLLNDADESKDVRGFNKSEIVYESDLELPPKIPLHLLRILEDVKADNKEVNLQPDIDVSMISKTHSDLGIFGNRYRLAFNKKERADYDFYRGGKHNVITFHISREALLPEWFKRQRDVWEKENAQEQHNFYKESIFG